jgi:hypothetical protein
MWKPWPLILIVVLLMAWKAVLWLDLPQPGADPVWYLSQTFSLLRGEWMRSAFGHHPIDPYPLPYMYGVLSLPFFKVFPWREYSIGVWSLLLIGLVVFFALRFLEISGIQSVPVKLIVIASILGSPYLYGPRPEVLNIALMFCGLVWLRSHEGEPRRAIEVGRLAFLSAIIGLVQPVGGYFFVAIVILFGLQHGFSVRFYVTYFLTTGIILAIAYGPVVLADPPHWFENFFNRFSEGDSRGYIDPLLFVKHSVYTPFIYVPYIVGLVRQSNPRRILLEIVIFAVAVIILLPFSRSYYYPYIMVFIVWRLSPHAGDKFPQWLAILVVLAAPFFTHYWPSVQQLENREYVATYRMSLNKLSVYSQIAEEHTLWVPSAFGMPVIQYIGSRLYFSYYRTFFGEGIHLRPEDVILAQTQADLQIAISLVGPEWTEHDLEVRQIVPETSMGLLRLNPFMGRSERIALWEVRLRQ